MSRNYSVPLSDSTCQIHFADSALKVVRGSKQYIYDDQGNEYLDCVSSSAHVGHCHPHVVAAGQAQMAKLGTSHGFLNETSSKFVKLLLETLPENLSNVYLCNSGSEANDLALRLARQYTRRENVAVFDSCYHGNLSSCIDTSAKVFRTLPQGKKNHIHLIPLPEVTREREITDSHALNSSGQHKKTCFDKAKEVLDKAQNSGRPIACFMSEVAVTSAGVVIPPKNYYEQLYQLVRHRGGVCIAIENQTGLGRTGHFWGFQAFDVVPDIMTVGKPLGNGYPVAAVVTTNKIASTLGDYINTLGGNPIACAVGTAVLEVIKKENVVHSAKILGKLLMEGLRQLMDKYTIVGDVRGIGLVIGIEIVCGRPNMKPAALSANRVLYGLKEERIVVSIQGPERNVICLTPPICFNTENVRRLIEAFDKVLSKVESENPNDFDAQPSRLALPGLVSISSDIITEQVPDPSTEDNSSKRRRRYEEMD